MKVNLETAKKMVGENVIGPMGQSIVENGLTTAWKAGVPTYLPEEIVSKVLSGLTTGMARAACSRMTGLFSKVPGAKANFTDGVDAYMPVRAVTRENWQGVSIMAGECAPGLVAAVTVAVGIMVTSTVMAPIIRR